jgi:hypothetical protein
MCEFIAFYKESSHIHSQYYIVWHTQQWSLFNFAIKSVETAINFLICVITVRFIVMLIWGYKLIYHRQLYE